MANYEEKILDAIEQIVDNAVANADYDRTVKATIVSCIDQTIGKFKVKYQDSTFYAYTTSSEVTYTAGTEVYVLIPGNDTSWDKTILGAVSKLGTDYTATPDEDKKYEVMGNNCITSSPTFELCSYKTTTEYLLYDKNNAAKDNKINLNTFAVEQYLKQSSVLICGASVKTELPKEQRYNGNYGIVYELVFNDNATGTEVIKNYVVDVNQMTGDPYNIEKYTRQYGIFELDGSNFKYVNKIYLFCYDFPYQDDTKPDDIFITDIELEGAIPLDSESLSSCALVLITPQGIYFDDSNEVTSLNLEAEVRVKGKTMDRDSQQLKYYWFIENVGITHSSKEYCKYGGQGWKCLNDYNKTIKAHFILNYY